MLVAFFVWLRYHLRNKWLKGLKVLTGSWVHGHGLWELATGCASWSEAAEVMAVGIWFSSK